MKVCNEIIVIKSHTLPYQDLNSSHMYFKYQKTGNMLQRQYTGLEGISVLAKHMIINFQRKALRFKILSFVQIQTVVLHISSANLLVVVLLAVQVHLEVCLAVEQQLSVVGQ